MYHHYIVIIKSYIQYKFVYIVCDAPNGAVWYDFHIALFHITLFLHTSSMYATIVQYVIIWKQTIICVYFLPYAQY